MSLSSEDMEQLSSLVASKLAAQMTNGVPMVTIFKGLRPEEFLTGREAAQALGCSWGTFRQNYLIPGHIKWVEGRRAFHAHGVRALQEKVRNGELLGWRGRKK